MSTEDAVCVRVRDDNIMELEALVIGPTDTPYAHGLFVFDVAVPGTYPMQPPKMQMMTTAGGHVRLNPNLYANGKVCATVLNTFGAAEWSPALRIESAILAIQSLMSRDPYHNEPNYEACSVPPGHHRGSKNGCLAGIAAVPAEVLRTECCAYAAKIRHEVLRVAIVYPLARALAVELPSCTAAKLAATSPPVAGEWRERIVAHFTPLLPDLIHECEQLARWYDGDEFLRPRFEYNGNACDGTFAFKTIAADLRALRANQSGEPHLSATEAARHSDPLPSPAGESLTPKRRASSELSPWRVAVAVAVVGTLTYVGVQHVRTLRYAV